MRSLGFTKSQGRPIVAHCRSDAVAAALSATPDIARAGSGLPGVAPRLTYDNGRIWAQCNQVTQIDCNIGVVAAGALWECGEVTTTSALVTPFALEYSRDYPAVYALGLLPFYDAIARMKTWGHWQSDVLAGAMLGATSGTCYTALLASHSVSYDTGFNSGSKCSF